MGIWRPASAAEAAEMVAQAAGEGATLEIVGGGSKRALGRPMAASRRMELRALSGVVDYDPAELVITTRPATKLADIEALLEGEQQMLGFEPPDWSALLSGREGPTVGGVIACNQAGPRRIRAGAARDHFLGFSAVNGWGEAWKWGGKVVKNVTGYDMCKLQAGAFGTLSVLTEVTLRVLPRPETVRTLVLAGLSDAEAIRRIAEALNAPHEVSAAAHLPATAAQRSAVAELAASGAPATLLRLEGPAPSVTHRANQLAQLMGGEQFELGTVASNLLWREVRDMRLIAADPDLLVWRVCPAPSGAAAFAARVAAALPATEAVYDWGGGLVWLAIPGRAAGQDGGASIVRGALSAGQATLFRAPEALRANVAVFQPEAPSVAALSRRIKAAFDPHGVLNPGRMHEGL